MKQTIPLVLPLLLAASSALALQQQLTRPRLVELSTRVVAGEVTATETRWAEGRDGWIETRVWLTVEQAIKGAAIETVEVKLDGGSIGRYATVVEDEPTLLEDHRYVLLLVQDEHGDWRVVGGEGGAIELRTPHEPGAPSLQEILPTLEASDAQ